MIAEIENENLKKELSIIKTDNEILTNFNRNAEKLIENLKKEISIVKNENESLNVQNNIYKTEIENLNIEIANLKLENDDNKEKAKDITLRKAFFQKQSEIKGLIDRNLNSMAKVRVNARTRRKLYSLLMELLRKGEIPYDDIKKFYWKTPQNRSRALKYLKGLGYVSMIKKNRKGFLVLSERGNMLKTQFEKIVYDDKKNETSVIVA